MANECRRYPRVPILGEAKLHFSGIVRSGTLVNISPSGVQVECPGKFVEQLSQFKSDAGLFPNLNLEFKLSSVGKKKVRSVCNVSQCRRLNQKTYVLGLSFRSLSDSDESKIADFIQHRAAA